MSSWEAFEAIAFRQDRHVCTFRTATVRLSQLPEGATCFLVQVINFLEWRSLYKRDRNSLQDLPNTSRLWSETSKYDYSATKTQAWRRDLNSCSTWRWYFAFIYSKAYCWFLRIPKARELLGWRFSPSWRTAIQRAGFEPKLSVSALVTSGTSCRNYSGSANPWEIVRV